MQRVQQLLSGPSGSGLGLPGGCPRGAVASTSGAGVDGSAECRKCRRREGEGNGSEGGGGGSEGGLSSMRASRPPTTLPSE